MRTPILFLLLCFLALPGLGDDQRRAREAVLSGEFLPLERILEAALTRHPGRPISIELDDDEYEVEILLDDGRIVELEYDARTGRLLEEEFEDD